MGGIQPQRGSYSWLWMDDAFTCDTTRAGRARRGGSLVNAGVAAYASGMGHLPAFHLCFHAHASRLCTTHEATGVQ